MKIVFFLLILSFNYCRAGCDAYINNEWPESRYFLEAISNDYVVIDTITGLMWKKCHEGRWGATCQNGANTQFNWEVALDSANAENYAGFTDWRVPNIQELVSIAARNCFQPAVNETIFPSILASSFRYWTSSPVLTPDTHAWAISFAYGTHIMIDRSETNLLILVRSID